MHLGGAVHRPFRDYRLDGKRNLPHDDGNSIQSATTASWRGKYTASSDPALQVAQQRE